MLKLIKILWKNKVGKIGVLVLITTVIGVFSSWYIKIFNQNIKYFNGGELLQINLVESTKYEGNYLGETVLVNVKNANKKTGEVIVEYILPNNLYFRYSVFIEKVNEDQGRVRILQDNKEIYNGFYNYSSPVFLYNKNKEPYTDDIVRYIVNNEYYPDDYIPSVSSTVKFAVGYGVEKRGEIYPVIMFFIVLVILLIDIKFPLLFFKLHNFMSVRDPEPSDFYIFMQKLGWYIIYPICLIVLLFMGIMGKNVVR